MKKYPISCVIITKNEEKRLGRTLESLQWCEDIVVVDSGSQDKTGEVAKQYGARFITREFDGYGPQKRYATEQAKYDWVLNIDADEVVTRELKEELTGLDLEHSKYVGYQFSLENIFLGKKLKFFGHPDLHIRLFNKRYAQFDKALVHEKVITEGRVLSLKEHVDHYSYQSIHHYFEKFNQYTTIAAQEKFSLGKRVGIFNIFARWLISWFRFYIIKGGFINGYQGFVWSFFSGFYTAVKYIKLKELNDRKKQNTRFPM